MNFDLQTIFLIYLQK